MTRLFYYGDIVEAGRCYREDVRSKESRRGKRVFVGRSHRVKVARWVRIKSTDQLPLLGVAAGKIASHWWGAHVQGKRLHVRWGSSNRYSGSMGPCSTPYAMFQMPMQRRDAEKKDCSFREIGSAIDDGI